MTMHSQYPESPGWKATQVETSEKAASEITGRAKTLRIKCYAAIVVGEKTADEVAAALGESVLSIRPRLSELVASKSIVATPLRRRNASGKSAVVWRVAVNEEGYAGIQQDLI